jgi:hypothetical protein
MKLDGCDFPSNNPLTGINEVNTSESIFSVYPNPASSLFNIELKNNNSSVSVTVTDVLGNQILSKTITDIVTTIDMSNYAKGMYFVTMELDKKISSQKIIIN